MLTPCRGDVFEPDLTELLATARRAITEWHFIIFYGVTIFYSKNEYIHQLLVLIWVKKGIFDLFRTYYCPAPVVDAWKNNVMKEMKGIVA